MKKDKAAVGGQRYRKKFFVVLLSAVVALGIILRVSFMLSNNEQFSLMRLKVD